MPLQQKQMGHFISLKQKQAGEKPLLVLLHGLLGDKQDWQPLCQFLPHFDCLPLDLPFHGEHANFNPLDYPDFNGICRFIAEQIQQLTCQRPYYLLGYSLGGRLALYSYCQQLLDTSRLRGLILEGANLGLADLNQRQQRWQQDSTWAKRFREEAFADVLPDWYRQAVFAHLSEAQRQGLIKLRQHNKGEAIAHMLQATSLAKQPDFASKVRSISLPFFYFCGSYDQKFQQMARQNQLNLTLIEQAGHNAHQENPAQFARLLSQKLGEACE